MEIERLLQVSFQIVHISLEWILAPLLMENLVTFVLHVQERKFARSIIIIIVRGRVQGLYAI